MDSFENLVNKTLNKSYIFSNKYNPIGKTYSVQTGYYEGLYWFYEAKDFIIEIHDFFVTKDYVITLPQGINSYMFLMSNYIIYGSGEWLNPYQVIEPRSIFISDNLNNTNRCVLHGNQRFFSVGIMFKEYIIKKTNTYTDDASQIFIESQKSITDPISKIANEILNCKMDRVAAELFFESKAKEWLSLSIDAFKNYRERIKLNDTDKASIESVAKYIEDHYAFNIPQVFLENIACMSGTKLKSTFKKKYNMSITEFTQRKRMNIAENLLLTTDLEINSIAQTIGYNCASRFSNLFKRYKGVYPKDIKKIANKSRENTANSNMKK